MKFRIEKNLKIISELMSFCYHFSTKDVNVNVKEKGDVTFITIDAIIDNFPKEHYETLTQSLNIPRQHEVEQYYWHLGGESELDCELTLIGMMVDKALISYENNILHIELERYA